jgi:prolyl oligopeptidase
MALSTSVNGAVEELIHGTVVRDPFRWLEDGNSIETKEWIADQQHRYEEYFATTKDLDAVRERVREYLDVDVVDQPARIADQYFYRRRGSGCEQACIYVRDIKSGRERRLVDTSFRDRFTSVGIHRISFDGTLLAYELKHGGADQLEIHIVDVRTGWELPDVIDGGYARGFTFDLDKNGFYYCQEQGGESADHMIRFHQFGAIAADEIIFRLPRSIGSRLVLIADEVRLGALCTRHSDGDPVSDLWIARRSIPAEWENVLVNFRSTYRPFLKGGHLFAVSLNDSPNGKLLLLDDDGHETQVIVPEQAQEMRQLVVTRDRVILTYLRDWGMTADSWSVSGEYLGTLDLPIDGTIRLLQPQGADEVFCTYESFCEPLTIFEFLAHSGDLTVWHKQPTHAGRLPCNTKPVVVSSKDGTQIPLILVSRNSSTLESSVPLIMTGYGGFGTFVTPQHSALVSIMLELGCTFVLARIRGGGEFGNAWHDAGRKNLRQNSFDDFIAAAEWLCANGITTQEKLAIFGGSNAGLLVGAVLTQRPELFRAILCIAPLLDMVRYETFDQAARWRHEYGTVDIVDEFRALHAYSPYHRIEDDRDYPPVLFISGDSDDRCNPAHVRKMAARLQQRSSQTRPILVDYSRDRGHSPVLPLSARIESLARRITFLCRELHITGNGESQ